MKNNMKKSTILKQLLFLSTILTFVFPDLSDAQDSTHWWNNTVFYEIFVRSYYDSNGDGNGDIQGLIQKLDYLNDGDSTTTSDLGITGIWLMPVTQSPSYHGYDVIDYRNIEQDYGTLADFKALVDSANARGIKVIIDLVMNHTSSQHPWFIDSASDTNSQYRDWYIWQPVNPGYRGPWGQQVWHFRNGAYYFGMFWSGMPDLNYANEQVKTDMFDITKFWLDTMKVDGFRLDAIKHLFENGPIMENVPATFDFLKEFRQFYKNVNPNALTVGEVWSSTDQVALYSDGTKVDFCFEFQLSDNILDAVKFSQPYRISNQMQTVISSYPYLQYAPFLANHDQNRVFGQLSQDMQAMKLAAAVYLTLPGIPFIYYGEEIGMTGSKPDENIRTPMQWSDDLHAGFTTGNPWYPVNANYDSYNVSDMQDEANSLWHWYRKLISLRNANESLRLGDYLTLSTNIAELYAYARRTANEVTIVVHNFQNNAINTPEFTLSESELQPGVHSVNNLLTREVAGIVLLDNDGGFTKWNPQIEINPKGTVVLEIDPTIITGTFTVSGFVRDNSAVGVEGVNIAISGEGSVTTNSDGFYSMSGVDSGTHMITPAKDGFTFEPTSLTTNVTSDITNQDFIATGTSTTADVTFDVRLPDSTPSNEVIYIAGTFNFWEPGPAQTGTDGNNHDLVLTRISDNQHQITLTFNTGESILYKYTRGSWETVEKGAQGEEIDNRSMVVPDSTYTQHDTVASWKDLTVFVTNDPDAYLPEDYVLGQNYPNPFNPKTTIPFAITRSGHVSLKIFNLLGEEVASLVNDNLPAGTYNIEWDASSFSSGIYFYRLQAGSFIAIKKLLVLQ